MKRFVKRNKLGKGKILHVSAPLVAVRDPVTDLTVWRVVRPGKTYRNPKRSPHYNPKKLTDHERRIYNARMKRKARLQ